MRPGARSAEPFNVDSETVEGFGDEWRRFDYEGRASSELDPVFAEYFAVFPWQELPAFAEGFDAGCGSGRWAERVAPRVGHLHCVDASSEALTVARRKLAHATNCTFHPCDIGSMPFADQSMDFGYSLGVLHHLPAPAEGLRACVRKLRPGAPFLVYFYYALENRPAPVRLLWRATDLMRRSISRLPHPLRYATTQTIAAAVYWPLARASAVLERAGIDVAQTPLAAYRHRSFYVMRTDALDRFGTRLEHRWSRERLVAEMAGAGLERIRVRDAAPHWCAVGYRASTPPT